MQDKGVVLLAAEPSAVDKANFCGEEREVGKLSARLALA